MGGSGALVFAESLAVSSDAVWVPWSHGVGMAGSVVVGWLVEMLVLLAGKGLTSLILFVQLTGILLD